jgi:phospholipase C
MLLSHKWIVYAKYFKDMTPRERAEATKNEWKFDDNDIFVDYTGCGNFTYHDNDDIEILFT